MLITCLCLLNYIYCIKCKMLNQFFFLWCFQQLPPVSEIIVESHARASKANLFVNPVREVLVVTWQYSVSPSTRPPTPQGNNVKSHTFSLVWEPATWYCTSVLWSIDCCQNRVCTDQYQMTFSRAEVSTHRGYVFLWSYPQSIQFQVQELCLKPWLKLYITNHQ